MDDAFCDEDRAENAYAHACDLYEALSETLAEVISALKARAAEGGPLRKEDTAILVAHQRAMLQVIECENDLFKRHRPAGGAGAPLDLEAARTEIAGRLDRLASEGEA